MTITNTNLRNDYTGNGSTTVYAFTFDVIYEVGSAKYSLKVITTDTSGVETVKTQGTDYTVALTSNKTGTITFATAPISGHKITILPDLSLTQETDYIKSGSDKFPAESHEKALDKLTLIAKQFFELFKRTIKLPNNSLLSEITIPVETSNANKAIVVNNAGNGLDAKNLLDINTYPITPFIETLLNDVNASEARQTLGVQIGSDVQAYNANLAALAGLTGAADKIPYFTDVGAMALVNKITSKSKLTHELSSGTPGGSSTAGSFQQRPLNTKVFDSSNIVTLSGNQFTLQAGTYQISAFQCLSYALLTGAPASATGRIRNITDSTTPAGAIANNCSIAEIGSATIAILLNISPFVITISSAKVFELQYFTPVAQTTVGLGEAASSGENEIYASVNIEKLG